jgi:hypothetical protein
MIVYVAGLNVIGISYGVLLKNSAPHEEGNPSFCPSRNLALNPETYAVASLAFPDLSFHVDTSASLLGFELLLSGSLPSNHTCKPQPACAFGSAAVGTVAGSAVCLIIITPHPPLPALFGDIGFFDIEKAPPPPPPEKSTP